VLINTTEEESAPKDINVHKNNNRKVDKSILYVVRLELPFLKQLSPQTIFVLHIFTTGVLLVKLLSFKFLTLQHIFTSLFFIKISKMG